MQTYSVPITTGFQHLAWHLVQEWKCAGINAKYIDSDEFKRVPFDSDFVP